MKRTVPGAAEGHQTFSVRHCRGNDGGGWPWLWQLRSSGLGSWSPGTSGAALRARDGECRDRSARALARLFLQGGDNWAAIRLVSQYKNGNVRVRRDPELSYLPGLAYYYEEMYDEASRQFQIALEADPKLVVPVFNLQSINARLIRLNTARAYQRAKEYDKALAGLRARPAELCGWCHAGYINIHPTRVEPPDAPPAELLDRRSEGGDRLCLRCHSK